MHRSQSRAASRAAFTLMEILLVVAVIATMATVVVLSLSGWTAQAGFDEGVSRFETALRMARADAADRNVRLRLAFDADGNAHVLYEPKPLEEPGTFSEFLDCTWGDFLGMGLVRVSRCELTGSSAYRVLNPLGGSPGGGDDEAVLDTLTFHPDGTSDTALVELRPMSDTDPRRALIRVGGPAGLLLTTFVDVDQLPDTYDQIRLEESGGGAGE